MKVCIKCQNDFKQNNYAGRIKNICNECHYIKQKEYRELNKERIKEYQKQYRLKKINLK